MLLCWCALSLFLHHGWRKVVPFADDRIVRYIEYLWPFRKLICTCVGIRRLHIYRTYNHVETLPRLVFAEKSFSFPTVYPWKLAVLPWRRRRRHPTTSIQSPNTASLHWKNRDSQILQCSLLLDTYIYILNVYFLYQIKSLYYKL